MPRDEATQEFHDGVPTPALERRVVPALTVSDQTLDVREQLGAGSAPVEQGRRVTAPKQVLHDSATDEGGTAQHQNVHGPAKALNPLTCVA